MDVLPDRPTGKQECQNHGPDANGVYRMLPHMPPKKQHERSPEGREERNQPDVV
jgi:hypothetical protein